MNSLNKPKKELLIEMFTPNIFAIYLSMVSLLAAFGRSFKWIPFYKFSQWIQKRIVERNVYPKYFCNMFYLIYPSIVSFLAAFGRSLKRILSVNFLNKSKKEMSREMFTTKSFCNVNYFAICFIQYILQLAAFGRSLRRILSISPKKKCREKCLQPNHFAMSTILQYVLFDISFNSIFFGGLRPLFQINSFNNFSQWILSMN